MKKLIILTVLSAILTSCAVQRTCPQAYPKKRSQLVQNNKF